MLLYVASPEDRVAIMNGEGSFNVDRVLFRPPAEMKRLLSRKSLANLVDGMENAQPNKQKKGMSGFVPEVSKPAITNKASVVSTEVPNTSDIGDNSDKTNPPMITDG